MFDLFNQKKKLTLDDFIQEHSEIEKQLQHLKQLSTTYDQHLTYSSTEMNSDVHITDNTLKKLVDDYQSTIDML